MKPLSNIAIVGGGNAGWLTAITMRRLWPASRVILIESAKTKAMVAGEAAPVCMVKLMELLRIPMQDFIAKTKATFKVGTKFTNWNGDGKHYYSPLPTTLNELRPEAHYDPSLEVFINSPMFHYWCAANGINFDDFGYGKLVALNKAPFIKAEGGFRQIGDYALHFNAVLAASYLRDFAMSLCVERVEGDVVGFYPESGAIQQIQLEGRESVSCDFVFDCTGFARLIIGKHFGSEWKDYTEYLPVNMGLPFFEPNSGEIPPYTEAIGMKYGWMWRVPLTDRFGCGYNFDSTQITVEEAKAEIQEYFGRAIEFQKPIPYNAGCYKHVWINNCIALGLSASFLEPLSSTNLSTVSLQLLRLLESSAVMVHQNKEAVAKFNTRFEDIHEQLMTFIYAHYMTKRSDSAFWKQFDNLTTAPRYIQRKHFDWAQTLPSRSQLANTYLEIETAEVWSSVDAGLSKYLEPFQQAVGLLDRDDKFRQVLARLHHVTDVVLEHTIPHREFLTIMTGESNETSTRN